MSTAAAKPYTPDDVAELRKQHVAFKVPERTDGGPAPERMLCAHDWDTWPCQTARWLVSYDAVTEGAADAMRQKCRVRAHKELPFIDYINAGGDQCPIDQRERAVRAVRRALRLRARLEQASDLLESSRRGGTIINSLFRRDRAKHTEFMALVDELRGAMAEQAQWGVGDETRYAHDIMGRIDKIIGSDAMALSNTTHTRVSQRERTAADALAGLMQRVVDSVRGGGSAMPQFGECENALEEYDEARTYSDAAAQHGQHSS